MVLKFQEIVRMRDWQQNQACRKRHRHRHLQLTIQRILLWTQIHSQSRFSPAIPQKHWQLNRLRLCSPSRTSSQECKQTRSSRIQQTASSESLMRLSLGYQNTFSTSLSCFPTSSSTWLLHQLPLTYCLSRPLSVFTPRSCFKALSILAGSAITCWSAPTCTWTEDTFSIQVFKSLWRVSFRTSLVTLCH